LCHNSTQVLGATLCKPHVNNLVHGAEFLRSLSIVSQAVKKFPAFCSLPYSLQPSPCPPLHQDHSRSHLVIVSP